MMILENFMEIQLIIIIIMELKKLLGEKLVPTSYSDNEIESFKHNERSNGIIIQNVSKVSALQILIFLRKIFY